MGRGVVFPGDIKLVDQTVSHVDMQFLEQQRWGVEEVARVFEMSPVKLGDMEHGSFENTTQSETQFWQMILDQAENTAEEITEFMIRPDFGRDLALEFRFDGISALQDDLLKRAQIDEIHLRSARSFVNELRERDGEDPVAWGDIPIVLNTMGPLDLRTPEEKAEMAPSTPTPRAHIVSQSPALDEIEARMEDHWAAILNKERREITSFIEEKWNAD